ncbi:MAG: hypothetical protein ACJA0N_001610 [Pseudohongiellaceae bacterium]|jgi:hypothetical protein
MRGNGEIINHIDHRLSFAFARTRDEIASTTVIVTDVNDPKGGVDKQCKVVVKPFGLREIVITEKRDDIRQAIDRCLARAGRCLNHKLKRKQALRKKTQDTLDIQPELVHAI